MTEQQDVLDPQRPRRRRIPVILLGVLPAAIAATTLVAGPNYVAPVAASTDASGVGKVASRSLATPGVVAPKTAVDPAASVQRITVIVPKVVAPAAKVVAVHRVTTSTTVKSVKTTKAVKKTVTTSTKAPAPDENDKAGHVELSLDFSAPAIDPRTALDAQQALVDEWEAEDGPFAEEELRPFLETAMRAQIENTMRAIAEHRAASV
jgi:hypothetical protein